MDRLAEAAGLVTRLLSGPQADDELLDRIAAVLAHGDAARTDGLRAALDATRSMLADPAADVEALPTRIGTRLARLTADSPPTAADLAALESLGATGVHRFEPPTLPNVPGAGPIGLPPGLPGGGPIGLPPRPRPVGPGLLGGPVEPPHLPPLAGGGSMGAPRPPGPSLADADGDNHWAAPGPVPSAPTTAPPGPYMSDSGWPPPAAAPTPWRSEAEEQPPQPPWPDVVPGRRPPGPDFDDGGWSRIAAGPGTPARRQGWLGRLWHGLRGDARRRRRADDITDPPGRHSA